MATEFCPHCGAVRNMQVAMSHRRVVDAQGRATLVPVRTLHCERCGTFVRSEDVKPGGAGPGRPSESGA